MRNVLIIGALLLVIGGGIYLTFTTPPEPVTPNIHGPAGQEIPAVTEMATDLAIPWDIAFLPDGSMLVTERVGNVVHVEKDGTKRDLAYTHSKQSGEGGLLGIALHPEFEKNRFVYIYMSAKSGDGTENRVVRFKYQDEELLEDRVVIDDIPGATYHDGGRIEFGPDGMLYIATGDATKPNLAQNITSLAGKILRLTPEGAVPSDNPYGTAIYSYGHRNPQGLAWDTEGRLWATEHGPTGELGLCCRDEVNRIVKGGNYGWPEITDTETKEGMTAPSVSSGNAVWAPASAAIIGDELFFGGLRGEALYKTTLDKTSAGEVSAYFKKEFGRIRTVRVGPDGMLYLTTSNRDGRGGGGDNMDKILRINPAKLP